jgi:hypothetical protein
LSVEDDVRFQRSGPSQRGRASPPRSQATTPLVWVRANCIALYKKARVCMGFALWLSQSPTPTKQNNPVWVRPVQPRFPRRLARLPRSPTTTTTPPPPPAPPPRTVSARPIRGAYPGSALPHRLAPLTLLRDEDSSRLLRFRSVSMQHVRLSFVRIVSTVARFMIIVSNWGIAAMLRNYFVLLRCFIRWD